MKKTSKKIQITETAKQRVQLWPQAEEICSDYKRNTQLLSHHHPKVQRHVACRLEETGIKPQPFQLLADLSYHLSYSHPEEL